MYMYVPVLYALAAPGGRRSCVADRPAFDCWSLESKLKTTVVAVAEITRMGASDYQNL